VGSFLFSSPFSSFCLLRFVQDNDWMLDDINILPLTRFLSPSNILAVFTSLLVERRIIFVADNLSTLSSCVQAAAAVRFHFPSASLLCQGADFLSSPIVNRSVAVPLLVAAHIHSRTAAIAAFLRLRPDALRDRYTHQSNTRTRTHTSPTPTTCTFLSARRAAQLDHRVEKDVGRHGGGGGG
jgi:hypothetical protein